MFSQLVEYLDKNRIIHPNLHGSRGGHDTSTALLQLCDRWVEDLEEKKMVGVLFSDQSAAFDLCEHTILLDKLELMGAGQGALAWIRSYLSNRTHSYFVHGELSTTLKLLECGVPQGNCRNLAPTPAGQMQCFGATWAGEGYSRWTIAARTTIDAKEPKIKKFAVC